MSASPSSTEPRALRQCALAVALSRLLLSGKPFTRADLHTSAGNISMHSACEVINSLHLAGLIYISSWNTMSRGYPVASYLPQTDPPTADAECAPSPYATRITDELYARWLELKKRKFTRGATMQELGISKHAYRCCSARYRQEVLMQPQVLPKPAPSKDLARFDPFYFR